MVTMMVVVVVIVVYGEHLCDGSVPKADWLNYHHVKLHLHLWPIITMMMTTLMMMITLMTMMIMMINTPPSNGGVTDTLFDNHQGSL